MPKMFQENNLEGVLKSMDYLFVLERAVVQFEPDDADYIRVTHQTFDHILETKSFLQLKSTRHFGAMAFYYCAFNKIDELLVELIKHESIEDAQLLTNIYYLVHDELKSNYQQAPTNAMDSVKFYTKESSPKRHLIELCVQAYEELQRQKMESEEGKFSASN
jgi:small subunit ribosomal protein S22